MEKQQGHSKVFLKDCPADNWLTYGCRVFSAEPNYYCLDGACAALMTEIAFVKVSSPS